jgi:hypothetical protein
MAELHALGGHHYVLLKVMIFNMVMHLRNTIHLLFCIEGKTTCHYHKVKVRFLAYYDLETYKLNMNICVESMKMASQHFVTEKECITAMFRKFNMHCSMLLIFVVSKPTYNPNVFSIRIRHKQMWWINDCFH